MECPSPDVIQDLLEGEVKGPEKDKLLKHVRECASCSKVLAEFMIINKGTELVVDSLVCPSYQDVKAYADNTIQGSERDELKAHLDLCLTCSTLLGFYQDPAKAEEWEKREQKIFEMAHAEEMAEKVSKSIIDKLLPGKVDFKQVWELACKLFQELSEVPLSSWPRLETSAVAGTLGFAGPVEPETMGALNIELVALGVAQGIVKGGITDQESIEKAVRDCAKNIGAGKELQKQLMSTLPALLKDAT